MLGTKQKAHIDLLIERYPKLDTCIKSIEDAFILLRNCYEQGGKLLIAGNGGSAADAEHICGELMKSFKKPRPIPKNFAEKLEREDPVLGKDLSKELVQSLAAISLVSNEALMTAYMNDVGGPGLFAQQVYGFGRAGDVFLGISTSGESKNIVGATVVAKAMGIKIIALTGAGGGKLAEEADVVIKAPDTETYKIQEYHLPIYHCLCQMLEDYFF